MDLEFVGPSLQAQDEARKFFEPHRPGAPLLWYSNGLPSCSYMICLLRCESAFANGVPEIPHGLTEAQYNML
eukprot:12418120-Karenia_brevis.AAC.1